jgi:hypothetical protein
MVYRQREIGEMTRSEAITYLTARYEEQCEHYTLMRRDISLELYLRRNVPTLLAFRNA